MLPAPGCPGSSYLPGKQRVGRLETELKEVQAREAALQGRLTRQDQRSAEHDQQVNPLRAEREALSRRLEELEKRLAEPRSPSSQSPPTPPSTEPTSQLRWR